MSHGEETIKSTQKRMRQELTNFYGLWLFAVLSDPDKRLEYDISGSYEIDRYSLRVCFQPATYELDFITAYCLIMLSCQNNLYILSLFFLDPGISFQIQRNDTYLQWSWYQPSIMVITTCRSRRPQEMLFRWINHPWKILRPSHHVCVEVTLSLTVNRGWFSPPK